MFSTEDSVSLSRARLRFAHGFFGGRSLPAVVGFSSNISNEI